MKKFFIQSAIAIFLAITFFNAKAQSNIPQFVNFQAVARDDSNNPIILKPIQIELTIRQGGASGTPVYGAVYEDSTNSFGEFSRRLGSTPTFTIPGVPSDFTTIPWQNGNMWVVIRYKSSIVGTFKSIGAFQYLTTPYSYASKFAEKLNIPGTSGQVLTYDGNDWKAGVNPGVPVGTIVPYAGGALPSGWLLCDGRSYSIIGTYATLYAAIGDRWGSGGAGSFNVPDLRGMFLRGWTDTSSNDPDAATRTASKPGGAIGNNVGSVQGDAFQGHIHNTSNGIQSSLTACGTNAANFPSTGGGQCGSVITGPASDGINGTPRTARETRPKNAYVMYIIKFQ